MLRLSSARSSPPPPPPPPLQTVNYDSNRISDEHFSATIGHAMSPEEPIRVLGILSGIVDD
ncbi:hypothetical protein BG004_003237 [Podila humilis]|nr:hypothetical protein BG004_003237 [Podila humilis]